MRLDKYLTKCGLGSRTETRKIIKAKRVRVNEEVVTNINLKLNVLQDEVVVDGTILTLKEFVYIMLHKPKGVISAASDHHHTTVIDLIEGYEHYNLFPIGRLDLDTTGLLILSNDGALTHQLITPKKEKPKMYLCTLRDPFEESYIEKIASGIQLKDFVTKPGIVKKTGDKECLLTITEGKYHQVKRMFGALENEITQLHRVSMNGLELDSSLLVGEYRELTIDELKVLKN